MRARLLADFSIVLMLSVVYFLLTVIIFFKSLLMYWNELQHIILCLVFVFLHLPLGFLAFGHTPGLLFKPQKKVFSK